MSTEEIQQIVSYLREKGKMSAKNIIYDLEVNDEDIDEAFESGEILYASPPHGAATYPWFKASPQKRGG